MDSYQLDQQTMDEMTEVLLRLYFAIQMWFLRNVGE